MNIFRIFAASINNCGEVGSSAAKQLGIFMLAYLTRIRYNHISKILGVSPLAHIIMVCACFPQLGIDRG